MLLLLETPLTIGENTLKKTAVQTQFRAHIRTDGVLDLPRVFPSADSMRPFAVDRCAKRLPLLSGIQSERAFPRACALGY